jgi:hypothetical protein
MRYQIKTESKTVAFLDAESIPEARRMAERVLPKGTKITTIKPIRRVIVR